MGKRVRMPIKSSPVSQIEESTINYLDQHQPIYYMKLRLPLTLLSAVLYCYHSEGHSAEETFWTWQGDADGTFAEGRTRTIGIMQMERFLRI